MQMEEMYSTMSSPPSSTNYSQELAVQGQKHLQDTIQSAFLILSAINHELCNAKLCSNTNDVSSDSSASSDIGGGALDQARLHYKASVKSLRSVLLDISNANKVKSSESVLTVTSGSASHQTEIKKLEEQALILRTELAEKNKYLNILIDQLRGLLGDISTWQSPCTV